jgi:N-acetyl-1-D-myo-inositol-2-amino-2-deoxy-alpha-D-glucopyranoside deacetylase
VSKVQRLTLLAVFAHPDDEAFGLGGSLSKYAAEGCEVYLVTATRGEAGQIAEPDMATPANLHEVRERELRCACRQYGIQPPILLDYVDGQLTVVPQGQAVAKLVRIIRELRPQVLVTFGPDGIYGHYDHIAVHRWATIAVTLAADPECFPGGEGEPCAPHAVAKVYHQVLPASRLAAMSRDGRPPTVDMGGAPFPFVGYADEEITTVVDATAYVERKVAGIRCHLTQVGRDDGWLRGADEDARRDQLGYESFILARSTVGRSPAGEREDDLFAGLR